MAFTFKPYKPQEDTATTRQGGGSVKLQDVVDRAADQSAPQTTVPKPKGAVGVVKDFLIPSRGFTDEEISNAQATTKDRFVGTAKALGEIPAGLFNLAHMAGNQAARGILPGWDSEQAAQSREWVNQKVDPFITPTTAGEAQTMRVADVVGLAAGTVTKPARLGHLKTALQAASTPDEARKVLRSGGVSDWVIDKQRLDTNIASTKSSKDIDELIQVAEGAMAGVNRVDVPDQITRNTVVHLPDQGVYARVPTEVARGLRDEVRTIPENLRQVHLSQIDRPGLANQREVPFHQLIGMHDDIPTALRNAGLNPARYTSRTPSRTPPPPRFARGADTMFPGAKVAANVPGQAPRSTAALSRQAQEIVNNSEKADLDAFISRNDDLGTAVTAEYLNKLARDYSGTTNVARKTEIAEESTRVVNEKSQRLLEAGREIQAASLLSRLTPEGQLRYISGRINRYNNSVPPKKRIPELTPEQSREVLDAMDDIRKTLDPTERQIKFFELKKKVDKLFPSKVHDKLSTVWKAGLLTGIKTSGLNILSNASHLVSEYASGLAAAGFDRVFAVFTGQRTTAATMRRALKGIKEGTVKGKRYFFTGFDERNIGEKLDYKRVNFGEGAVGRTLQAYTDTVFQTIGAQDQPFYYSALARSYVDQALAQAFNEGLKGKAAVRRAYEIVESPSEAMMENAVRDATTAVFTNETVLGKVARHAQNTPVIGQFIIPFARTPSAVATQIMNYTPVGAVSEVIHQIRKGTFDQRKMSKALGRSTLGTVPMYIGWELAGEGRVSLQYPSGDSRQIELDKAEGVEYNSVKIGDEWRNPIVLGPAGLLILMGAHIRAAMEKSGSPNEAVVQGGLGLYETLTEQTFLTGLTNFTSMIEDLQRSGSATMGNFVASFVPTIISDIARATDTAERRAEGVAGRIARRVPGARQQLEPEVDILGREQGIAGRGNDYIPDFFESMADPTRPSQDVSNDVTKELGRLKKLAEEKKDNQYNVSPTRSGLEGYEVLTPEQETRLQQDAGKMIAANLQGLFYSPRYQQASDEEKADAVNKLVKMSKDTARARMVLQILEQVPASQRQKALIRMKDDGLITTDVLRVLNGS